MTVDPDRILSSTQNRQADPPQNPSDAKTLRNEIDSGRQWEETEIRSENVFGEDDPVNNPPPATTLEMQTGTEIALRSVSPKLVADAIAALAAGGGTPLDRYVAEAFIGFGANPAGFTSRNGHGVLTFDDTTQESAFAQGVASVDLDPASPILVDIYWMAATAIAGTGGWLVSFERGNTDLDADSFAAAQSGSDTAPGTSGLPGKTTIPFTIPQADGLVAGDPYRLLVQRNVGVGGNVVGDLQLLRAVVRQ